MTRKVLQAAASADDLLNAHDPVLDAVEVNVPNLGFSVKVRGMTRGEVRRIIDEIEDKTEIEANAIATCVVEPPFTLEQATKFVTEKGSGTVGPILDRILDLSGLTPGFRQD